MIERQPCLLKDGAELYHDGSIKRGIQFPW